MPTRSVGWFGDGGKSPPDLVFLMPLGLLPPSPDHSGLGAGGRN
ncbi:MAG: hypothetical protein OXH05_07025 [Acidobacteria bacterium]|nr:hypothetical protein [Acidobacteriota bacterium]